MMALVLYVYKVVSVVSEPSSGCGRSSDIPLMTRQVYGFEAAMTCERPQNQRHSSIVNRQTPQWLFRWPATDKQLTRLLRLRRQPLLPLAHHL
jgi:hypothetical protein